MPKTMLLTILAVCFILSVACGRGGADTTAEAPAETLETDHMVAQATLAAYYMDAAISAGMTTQKINVALGKIASETVISEFWVSDEAGHVDYTNVPDLDFAFPTNPNAES